MKDERKLWVVEIRESKRDQWRATTCVAEARAVARQFSKQFTYCLSRVRCYVPREEKL